MAVENKMHFAFACVEQLGHFMPLVPFIRELLQRGHHVTLFVSDSEKYKAKLVEFKLEDAERVPVPLLSGHPHEVLKPLGVRYVLSKGGPLAVFSDQLFDAILSHYASAETLPSVIVADFFATAAIDAGDKLGVPVVTIFPNPLGVGPGLLKPELRGLSQRFRALLCRFAEGLGARIFLAMRNKERRGRRLPAMVEQDIFPCDTMKRPTINTWGLGFEYAALQSPLHTFVGPSEPASFPPVTGELATWLDQQKQPVVYVAFGTMHHFSKESCRCLLEQLDRLVDVAVLWSLPATQQALLEVSSSKVRLEVFVPQYAVLKHPKVVAFVSHCGSNSVGESILAETPLVCCPGMADQPANAARVTSAGVGVVAHGGVGGVGAAVRVLLNDREAFHARVHKLKCILLSHGGAQRGADVIEAVATCGYEHLVPRKQRLPIIRTLLGVLGVAFVASVLKQVR